MSCTYVCSKYLSLSSSPFLHDAKVSEFPPVTGHSGYQRCPVSQPKGLSHTQRSYCFWLEAAKPLKCLHPRTTPWNESQASTNILTIPQEPLCWYLPIFHHRTLKSLSSLSEHPAKCLQWVWSQQQQD